MGKKTVSLLYMHIVSYSCSIIDTISVFCPPFRSLGQPDSSVTTSGSNVAAAVSFQDLRDQTVFAPQGVAWVGVFVVIYLELRKFTLVISGHERCHFARKAQSLSCFVSCHAFLEAAVRCLLLQLLFRWLLKYMKYRSNRPTHALTNPLGC